MERRDIGTAVAAALPILASIAAERIVGKPMDDFLKWPWSSLVLLVLAIVAAGIYLRFGRKRLGPTRADLEQARAVMQGERDDFQEALDKMIDTIYVLPIADRPPEGISTGGIVRDHSDPIFRRDEYLKLGLPEPKPHKSQRR
jgi:hypothetical protein